MKKIALTIGLVILLVGSVMGGLALHANAATPTLKAWGSSAPGTVTITGTNWTPAVRVDLDMDLVSLPPPIPDIYEVAYAYPGSNGVFTATFTIGKTSVGDHTITAIQGGLNQTATFTITNTSQIDPLLHHIQSQIDSPDYGLKETKSEIKDITANTTWGLPEIKSEVKDITANTTWGLPQIQTKVKNIENWVISPSYGLKKIETDVGGIQDSLAHLTTMDPVGDYYDSTTNFTEWQTIAHNSYDYPRHIAVTVYYQNVFDNTQGIRVSDNVGGPHGTAWFDAKVIVGATDPPSGVINLEFVGVGWSIDFKNGSGNNFYFYYDVAAEGVIAPYPPSPP